MADVNQYEQEDSLEEISRVKQSLPLIFILAIFCGLAGFVYTLISKPIYKASASIYIPLRSVSILGGSGATDAASSVASSVLGSGPSPIKVFHGFLESERTLNYVEKKTGLDRKDVLGERQITDDEGANLITISSFRPTREDAKQMVEYYIQSLRSINSDVTVDSISQDTVALQTELDKQKKLLATADAKLVEFQKRAKSSPGSVVGGSGSGGGSLLASDGGWSRSLAQLKVSLAGIDASLHQALALFGNALLSGGKLPADIPPIRKFRPQLVDAEYQLRLLSKSLGPNAPDIVRLKERIASLHKELDAELIAYVSAAQKGLIDPGLALAPDSGSAGIAPLLSQKVAIEAQIAALENLAKAAPTENTQLAQLQREVVINTEAVRQATAQLTLAKLQSLRDPNKWSLLDPAQAFEQPTNKRFVFTTVTCAFVGLALGLLYAMIFAKSKIRTSSV